MVESMDVSEIPDSRTAAAALLAYYADLGVEVGSSEMGIDRFAESEAAAAARAPAPQSRPEPPQSPAPARPAPAAPAMTNEMAAATAGEAKTLDELKDALSRFDGCALSKTATNLCFASGNPEAKLMFVGEAPGREEDLQGEPFVGRAGQLLDKMLAAIGRDRTSCYIANVIYWRPPGNRNPNPEELVACRPFINKQIELVDPDVLVFLGGVPAKEMLSTTDGILKLRGRWRDFDTGKRTIPAIATLHPAYLLRQPAQKKLAWKDFRAIRDKLA